MQHDDLIRTWKAAEQQPFAGWDFAFLHGRMVEERPPWSYMALAEALLRHSSAVLDMGTGGGERLLELQRTWPATIAVTEDYPPNIQLARERLEPLGVRVVAASLGAVSPMPFADGEFDLILNRHSSLNPIEIARILAPDGDFLSQQIHGLWAQDLLAEFGASPPWPEDTLENVRAGLVAAGLEIARGEDWQGRITFHDTTALVLYLKAVPWLVPNFAVETHAEPILRLEARLQAEGALAFEARKFLIHARKR